MLLGIENVLGVVVEKYLVWIEVIVNCGELILLWIVFMKCGGGLIVMFILVWLIGVVVYDFFDGVEVVFEFYIGVLMNCDVVSVVFICG